MTELGPSPLIAGDRHLSVAEARAAIHAALQAAPPAPRAPQTVPLAQALGRVLAEDLVSPMDVPPHDNSAMDGYAFDGSALAAGLPLRLRVVATVYAGAPFGGAVAAGECVRIMTGAVMPAGLDTVVPQELVRAAPAVAGARDGADAAGQAEGGHGAAGTLDAEGVDGADRVAGPAAAVDLPAGVVRRGENRRRAGEDLARGKPALVAGRVLRPADIGLAASLGVTALRVWPRLKVALFSTGNEVFAPGDALPAGGIYDSNRYSLQAALQRLGVEVLDLGLVRDDPHALQAVLARAVREADAVVTSGGVSVGDADHTRAMLDRLGRVAFWKVAMRPGRPFAFGPLAAPDTQAADGDGRPRWLFALPGNPVAALVTFYAFAREALLWLAGARPEPLPVLQARCTEAIRKRPGRTEFQRGIVQAGPAGWQVALTGGQGAGILRSMSQANCLVVLGHDQGSVAAGDPVDVWLFDGLV